MIQKHSNYGTKVSTGFAVRQLIKGRLIPLSPKRWRALTFIMGSLYDYSHDLHKKNLEVLRPGSEPLLHLFLRSETLNFQRNSVPSPGVP